MGSREDDDWFNTKYAEASCHVHGEDDMSYDDFEGEWCCGECFIDDELKEIHRNG